MATEYVVFGGDCELTPAGCLLEEVGGRVIIRLGPEEIRRRVPRVDYGSFSPEAAQPGFFPIAYAVFICRSHAGHPSDVTFRDNLLNILLF